MTITFDEALKAIDEKSDMEPYSGLFLIEIEDAKAIVMKLANTYAPTIEMTKAEKTMLLNYLEMSSLREFMDVILYQNGNLYEKLSDEDIVQAWLHPETIKVVE